MSSIWGKNINVSLFGESHGELVGVTIDGLPSNVLLDMDYILGYMSKRKPGGHLATPRMESDTPKIVSGVLNGKTTGAPLTALIFNENTKSGDYEQMSHTARPGHADYTAFVKYGGANDCRGGGHFSARLTVGLVFAGAICSQILKNAGIDICAHIRSIEKVVDNSFDVDISRDLSNKLNASQFPLLNEKVAEKMQEAIEVARAQKDSVGGVVECAALGLPAGLGSPIFDGIENKISSIIFGIPAVKGIEFGLGFESATLRGSQNNDEFYIEKGKILTKTNNCGGILGGITNGMPLSFKVAFKPTPSIAQLQNTVDFVQNTQTQIEIKGRHDPCVVIRGLPCVTAATAIAILDILLENRNGFERFTK